MAGRSQSKAVGSAVKPGTTNGPKVGVGRIPRAPGAAKTGWRLGRTIATRKPRRWGR